MLLAVSDLRLIQFLCVAREGGGGFRYTLSPEMSDVMAAFCAVLLSPAEKVGDSLLSLRLPLVWWRNISILDSGRLGHKQWDGRRLFSCIMESSVLRHACDVYACNAKAWVASVLCTCIHDTCCTFWRMTDIH